MGGIFWVMYYEQARAVCVPTHWANFTQVCVRLLVKTVMAAKFYSVCKWLSWVFGERGCVDVGNKARIKWRHTGGVYQDALSCHVLLLSHVVATAALRKTPPTGTRGLRRGVGLALFLSPLALLKGNTETQGDGAATKHQSRSRATLKRETA